jgi:hypothetical protein
MFSRKTIANDRTSTESTSLSFLKIAAPVRRRWLQFGEW